MRREEKGWRRFPLIMKMIIGILLLALVIGVIHVGDALLFGRRTQYRERQLSVLNLPEALDGYTIALVTDTHSISDDDLEAMRQRIAERAPDLLLLGGDYERSTQSAPRILGGVDCPDGIFAVEGNHDVTADVKQACQRAGIGFLYNEGVAIRTGLYVGGVADLWGKHTDVSAALAGKRSGDFAVLLAHNPDVAMLPDAAAANLLLSGHTHGGQMTFFGLWKPALRFVSNYGGRFGGGWAKGVEDTVDVYVSKGAGYGTSWTYQRIFAHPEVVFITLRASHSNDDPTKPKGVHHDTCTFLTRRAAARNERTF